MRTHLAFLATCTALLAPLPARAIEVVAQMPVSQFAASNALQNTINQILACSKNKQFYDSTTNTCISPQVVTSNANVTSLKFLSANDSYNKTVTADLSGIVPATVQSMFLRISFASYAGLSRKIEFSFDLMRGTSRSWKYNLNGGSDNFQFTLTYDGANKLTLDAQSNDLGYYGVYEATVTYGTIQ